MIPPITEYHHFPQAGCGIVENRKDRWSAKTGFPQSHSLDDDHEFFNNYSKTGLDSL